jgi:hypothetical protein
MSFNDYWEAKAAKRRKAWAAKAKRFAEKHMQLEDIRSELFFSYVKREELLSLWNEHRTVQNPIARWDSNMHFSFSEQGLREAMQAAGADVSSLTMTIGKTNIVGQQPHEITHGGMLNLASNRRDLYEKYTNLETCTISYREVKMVIYRYTYQQQPFALYEFVPCLQLPISISRLEETSFSTLNIATLLMEIAAEYELRQEELNYHAKKLKLRTMKAIVDGDKIEYTLWDDKKLAKKVKEYIAKGYTINEVIEHLLRPYKAALNKYFDVAVERTIRDTVPTLKNFKYHNSNNEYFFEQELRPLLEAELDGVELEIKGKSDKTITINYHGCQCCLESSSTWSSIRLIPHVGYEKYTIPLPPSTPLSAIGGLVRQMPTINHRTDEYIVKALQIYDKLMCQQNEEYHAVVEHLGALATQHAGMPVGMLMKYLRWNTARLLSYRKHLYPLTIAVTGGTAFSYTEREVKDFLTSTYEDVFKEKWMDAECRYLYGADPETTDANEWIKAHSREGIFGQARWAHDVRSFVGYGNDDTFLSVKFIHEKL